MEYEKQDFTNLIWAVCEADIIVANPRVAEFRERYTLSDMLEFYEVSNG